MIPHPSGSEPRQAVLRADEDQAPDLWGLCAGEPHVDLVDVSTGRRWRRSHARRSDPPCDLCPVAGECLLWALDHDVGGVWGGTEAAERVEFLRPGWIPTPSTPGGVTA